MIKHFNQFIAEAVEDTEKLSHLEHAEDHVINAGEEGAHHAARTLVGVHHAILGHKTPVKVTTKYDGAPAIVFGTHPETKKFFVSSKSAFNKTPKINYTHEDVDKNHGHSPGLAAKLKGALTHLPKVTPPGKIYQGDVMYSHGDVETSKTHHSFKPNTIKYSVKKDSPTGQKVGKAKIGVAVHTEYKGDSIANLKAHFAPDTSDFKTHDDAHIIGTHTKHNAAEYAPEARVKFFSHIKKAKDAAQGKDFSHLDHPVRDHVKTYINATVRSGTTPSVDGLTTHISNKHDAKKALVKTPAAKERIEGAKQDMLRHVDANRGAFKNTLAVHKHLQGAKNVLVKALSKSDEFEHHIGGKESGPEGHVAIVGSKPTKLVDRGASGFAAQNMNAGGIKQSKLKEDKTNTPKITFKETGGKKKFAVHMLVGGKHVGTHEYDHTTGRSTAEIFPEHRAKGYGKLLVLKTIHSATMKGNHFTEDESRTKAYDDTVDSLENSGHIARDDNRLYITHDGLKHLNKHIKKPK